MTHLLSITTKRNFLVTFLRCFGFPSNFWPLYEVGDWMNIVLPRILSGALPASVQNTPSQHDAQQTCFIFFFFLTPVYKPTLAASNRCVAINTFVLFFSMNTLTSCIHFRENVRFVGLPRCNKFSSLTCRCS